MNTRINDMNFLIEEFSKIYDFSDIIKKNNLKKIDNGSFNDIKLFEYQNKKIILRIPNNIKPENETTSTTYDEEFDHYISVYYFELLSKCVKQNLWIHFPIIYKTYFNTHLLMEYCDQKNLNVFVNNSNNTNTDCKNVILQSLLTMHFMNKTLKISHNDSKTLNVLIKTIDECLITYKLNNKHSVTIQTKHLALITDFDKTRGTNCKYDYYYVLEYYFKYLCKKIYQNYSNKNFTLVNTNISVKIKYLEDSNIDVIDLNTIFDFDNEMITFCKTTYKHLFKYGNPMKIDICLLLIFFLVSSKKKIRNLSKKFIKYYLFKNFTFIESIKLCFHNIFINDFDEDLQHYTYKMNIDIDDVKKEIVLPFNSNIDLYTKIFIHKDIKNNFLDTYINSLFNIEFVINNENIVIKENSLIKILRKRFEHLMNDDFLYALRIYQHVMDSNKQTFDIKNVNHQILLFFCISLYTNKIMLSDIKQLTTKTVKTKIIMDVIQIILNTLYLTQI